MSIEYYENLIQAKRKTTPFRKFVLDIASKLPVMFYKRSIPSDQWMIAVTSTLPDTPRSANIINGKNYFANREFFMSRWRSYDASKSFFENFSLLFRDIPLASRFTDDKSTESEHATNLWMSNKVYLSILAIDDCENILYTFYVQDHVTNVLNSVMVWDHSENVYFSSGIIRSYNVFYSRCITGSSNIWFSTDLIGCSECILCDSLENKNYHIRNTPYEKEEYFREKEKIFRDKSRFLHHYKTLPRKWSNFGSRDVKGKFCIYSENIENGFFSYRVTNGRNIFFVGDKDGRRNVYDTICSDQTGEWDLYGCINMGTASNCYLSDSFIGHSLYYSYNCLMCSFCIGCIGLENRSYCILNKQYTKEEWEILAEKIFSSMEQDGTLGEPLPPGINPFYFNDTLAYLIDDSFTKEEVERSGFLWRDAPIKVDIPEGLDQIGVDDLAQYESFGSDGSWRIDPSIMQKVIRDANGNYYRIVKTEYDFLLKYELPLPTLHWIDRMKLGFRW